MESEPPSTLIARTGNPLGDRIKTSLTIEGSMQVGAKSVVPLRDPAYEAILGLQQLAHDVDVRRKRVRECGPPEPRVIHVRHWQQGRYAHPKGSVSESMSSHRSPKACDHSSMHPCV